MKSEEIAQILGMGKSLVEEYIRILNEITAPDMANIWDS